MAILIKHLFFPKDKIFFSELKKLGSILTESSEYMILLLSSNDKGERTELVKKIKSNKTVSTNIYRNIFKKLSKNLFTPYDREDIYCLSNSLRILTNKIYKISRMLQVYNLNLTNEGIKHLSLQIKDVALLLVSSVNDLQDLTRSNKIIHQIQEINAIEHRIDLIYNQNLEKLFHSEKDVKEIIKQKEVYQYMVNSIRHCKEAASDVESLLVKYA